MVGAMVRAFRLALLAAVAATLCACGRPSTQDRAAAAARELLAAAWSEDARAFESHVDRPAVRQDLRRRLSELAQANTLSVEGGASDAVLDRMIAPAAFRLVDTRGGALTEAPSEAQIRLLVSPMGKDRACLHSSERQDQCLLTFGRDKRDWRLVGMAPAGFTIVVPPEPPTRG
jgi:hypothetical protein